jgi:hypothetical protein
MAIIEATEQRIIVGRQEGFIDINEFIPLKKPKPTQTTPAVTPSKSKPKVISLPDKLVGKGTGVDEVYRPKATYEKVPGKFGQILQRSYFMNCHPRPADHPGDLVDLKIVVIGEPDREATVRRNDAIICEILGGAFASEEFPEADRLMLLTVPFKMTDGAVFKFERIRGIVKLSLEYITWDQRTFRFGVEVPPTRQAILPSSITRCHSI